MATITINRAKAEAIAWTNAQNMAGYTKQEAGKGLYWVASPEKNEYLVNPKEGMEHCGCPFHKENGCCKHVFWLQKEIADEARWEEEAEVWEERQAARGELESLRF